MFVFAPLRNRSIARLWIGQVLSNVGDEIYNIAIVWLAAGLIGVRAGYVSALQAASIFLCGTFGARWADAWDHRRTMISVDVLRGMAVLLIPFLSLQRGPTLGLLLVTAIAVSSLSAFFLPALKASLPRLAPRGRVLDATNGLMESTPRLARVIGPAVVGLLNAFIPLVHFFTIDAISFFCSAISIHGLDKELSPVPLEGVHRSGMREAFAALRNLPRLRFALLTGPIMSAVWWLVLPLGMGLLLHERRPSDVGALGWLISAYGVGNLSANLAAGSLPMRRPIIMLSGGRMLAGAGFIVLAWTPHFWLMMGAASVAACGGPMTDLAWLSMLGNSGDARHVARTYRLGMTLDYGCMVVGFLISPWLFAHLGISPVIVLCGTILLSFGVIGLALERRLKESTTA